MLGVVQASLVSMLLPAGIVALVGDVALASTGLELPEVEPGLVVLREQVQTQSVHYFLTSACSFTLIGLRSEPVTCSQG